MQEARTINIRSYITVCITLFCILGSLLCSLCSAQVGACLVTPAPHRLVAMGYNGMPDGRGFKDERMDWGLNQKNYSTYNSLAKLHAIYIIIDTVSIQGHQHHSMMLTMFRQAKNVQYCIRSL